LLFYNLSDFNVGKLNIGRLKTFNQNIGLKIAKDLKHLAKNNTGLAKTNCKIKAIMFRKSLYKGDELS